MAPKRKVFVSYHHGGDRHYYDAFVRLFADAYELVHDNSVDRPIGSEDPDYVIRRIREQYLTGASTTVVLCGRDTWGRKYVDWEILSSLNQDMALVGLRLPTSITNADGRVPVPPRLYDNIASGYAIWTTWSSIEANPSLLTTYIEDALRRAKSTIDNSRPRRLQNAPLA